VGRVHLSYCDHVETSLEIRKSRSIDYDTEDDRDVCSYTWGGVDWVVATFTIVCRPTWLEHHVSALLDTTFACGVTKGSKDDRAFPELRDMSDGELDR
jgi:hypothetical protein